MKSVKLSVHKIIDFVLRCGDIDSRFYDSSSMYKGAAAHRKIQKESGDNYKKEVTLKLETEIEGIPVLLQGRADGIITEPDDSVTIDEIKSTTLPLDYIYKQHLQHLGQGKVYAYMYLQTLENPPESVKVQLTYYQLESEEIRRYHWNFTSDELSDFFNDLLSKYGFWLRFERDWQTTRDAAISETTFPFETYRKGQRELAVAAYRTIEAEKKLYVSAPTGIGKTLSALFPSIKALGKGMASKIFYLTAKTVTRTVAEEAVRMMMPKNLRIKSITLRAKEKICINGIHACNPEQCQNAKGHYDRVNEALADIISNNDLITPAVTIEYAQKHHVCPHEFGLDAALWCDLVIGDYNHVFDPTVYLKRFFDSENNDYIFLIDEAHNLVDRVRDMYTASLRKGMFSNVRKQLKDKDPLSKNLKKALRQINAYLVDVRKEIDEDPSANVSKERDMVFAALVTLFSAAAGEWLAARKNSPDDMYGEILNLYFEVGTYLMIAEQYDEHNKQYITITDIHRNDVENTLFCLDPSAIIAAGLKRAKSSVLFSATLTPLPYFREILGGGEEDAMLMLPSPFDPSRFITIAHHGISTKYIHREESHSPISEAIFTAISSTKGNYLIFFPSYAYMQKVYEIFCENYSDVDTLLQTTTMSEETRADFLARFDENNPKTLVGFTVLGGIFSEGIDLKGDRLIGSIIIGVGIPKITMRHDLVRDYFNQKNGNGYDYAYVYPGMNKVLQAAGRVIRTESDSGFVLLIDNRYAEAKYRGLFPKHWTDMKMIRETPAISLLLEQHI